MNTCKTALPPQRRPNACRWAFRKILVAQNENKIILYKHVASDAEICKCTVYDIVAVYYRWSPTELVLLDMSNQFKQTVKHGLQSTMLTIREWLSTLLNNTDKHILLPMVCENPFMRCLGTTYLSSPNSVLTSHFCIPIRPKKSTLRPRPHFCVKKSEISYPKLSLALGSLQKV